MSSSRKDLRSMPGEVQDVFGYALIELIANRLKAAALYEKEGKE